MSSEHIVDIGSDLCIIVIDGPLIKYTRTLFCNYATRINCDCIITSSPVPTTNNPFPTDTLFPTTNRRNTPEGGMGGLRPPKRILIFRSCVCIGSNTPDLFSIFGGTELVWDNLELSNNNFKICVDYDDMRVLKNIRTDAVIEVNSEYYAKQVCDILSGQCLMIYDNQLDPIVIDDIIEMISGNKIKMLVFGGGSENTMWSKLLRHRVIFIDSNSYENNVCDSFGEIEDLSNIDDGNQFDIILIIENSLRSKAPAIKIASKLARGSHKRTVIYVSQSDRLSEKYNTNRYFGEEFSQYIFSDKNSTVKFTRG